MFTFGKSGLGGEHLLKAGVQWGRLYYSSDYSVQGDHYVEYNSGVPTQVRQFNTPVVSENIARVTGFFVQDSVVDEPPDAERRRPLGQVRRRAAGPGTPGGRFIGAARRSREAKSSTRAAACGASARPTT